MRTCTIENPCFQLECESCYPYEPSPPQPEPPSPTLPTPETQARLAAEMCRLQGYRAYIDATNRVVAVRPDIEAGYFDPWHNAAQAIAFADWAEREHGIRWRRDNDSSPTPPEISVQVGEVFDVDGTLQYVEITPTTPFPAALTLAVCRAIEPLRKILEAHDE